MALSINHPPKLKIPKLENGKDIISSLPDSVLIHILSLIPTKYAVRTSILSSRWENLWTFVPNLVFGNFLESLHHQDVASLMKFVDRVFFFHNLSCIQRFSLSCSAEIDKSRLNNWIGVAIKRSVREISLETFSIRLQLPRSLFTCKSLVNLKLWLGLQFDVPEVIHFPCLKTFHLSIKSPSNDLAQRLFNSCPVLEKLSLMVSVDSGERTFNLSLPALKKLHIRIYACDLEFDSVFVIDAPVLESLLLNDNRLTHYVLKNPSSIVKARLWFANPAKWPVGRIRHLNEEFALVKAISQIKHLYLNDDTMAVFGLADENDWPLFPNVIHLRADVENDSGFKSLSILLNKVPKLESLHFVNMPVAEQRNLLNWFEPRESPNYVQTCLKHIEFWIRGFQSDLNSIKYFLENARVLRKLTINCEIPTKAKEDKFYGQLVKYQKCSEACNIIFINRLRKFVFNLRTSGIVLVIFHAPLLSKVRIVKEVWKVQQVATVQSVRR